MSLSAASLFALIATVSASAAAHPQRPIDLVFSSRHRSLEAPGESFRVSGRKAEATLLRIYYAGGGEWRECNASTCTTGNRDWGVDSLTYALALRFHETRDRRLLAPLRALTQTAPVYPAPCTNSSTCSSWSDVPEWDAIALLDEYAATGDQTALTKAEAAFAFVAQSSVYARGACSQIDYQQPGGGTNQLKTLETDSNLVKAALLLYRATHLTAYLETARAHYASSRAYFFEPKTNLYTVYVFDNGRTCVQLPRRFFASVNGNMIWNGVELFRDTGTRSYLDQAIATAKASVLALSDGRGILTDLQAENDVVEPLVEGMDALAEEPQGFARDWILRNAAAALSARTPDGSFGRFFDGPPPETTVTAWQTNGGLAAEIAAASLAPDTVIPTTNAWAGAVLASHEITALPATLGFYGSGVALIGTLGESCCESGHARVLIDGRETADATGIWQNKSSLGTSIDNTVLFAWRWPSVGHHSLTFEPGIDNPKEGGSFLHIQAFELLRAHLTHR